MVKLSVVILAKNEENNILDCLERLVSVHEIIVVDDYSQDRTVEIIKSIGRKNIKLFQNHLDGDFSKQRNFALKKVSNDWVLFVDSDERVSTSLYEEIKQKTANSKNRKINGYYIKRHDVMWGRELKYGETGNIKLLRLARKNAGKWEGKVHERWEIEGEIGELENELTHYPHQTIREFLREINYYSTIRAGELHAKHTKIHIFDIVLYPKTKFFLNYFLRLGFLDGLPGLIVALMMSFHSFLVRSKLWLLNNER